MHAQILWAAGLFIMSSGGLVAGEAPLRNYENTYQCPESSLFGPASLEEVQTVVMQALRTGRKVMTGTKGFRSQIDAA